MKPDRYDPVPFDVEASHKRWMKRPGYAAAYDALADEFAALGELLSARQQAGMTQAQVAERMGIAQATVARLESSAGSRKHAPSIATLRRYADAVGCDLHLTLRPSAKSMRTSARKPMQSAKRKPATPAKKAAAKKAAAKKAAKRAGKAKRPAANQRSFAMKRAASKPARGQRARA